MEDRAWRRRESEEEEHPPTPNPKRLVMPWALSLTLPLTLSLTLSSTLSWTLPGPRHAPHTTTSAAATLGVTVETVTP